MRILPIKLSIYHTADVLLSYARLFHKNQRSVGFVYNISYDSYVL